MSTVYQAIQASPRNPEGNYVHEERSSEDGTPLLNKKQEMTNNAARQGHTHKRNSHYENAQQNNTTVDFTEVARILKSQDKCEKRHLRQALDKYFKDWKQKNDQVPASSFVYSSKHLPSYLVNSIMEVFYQLDINGTGRVSMMDFRNICEILHLPIVAEEKETSYKKKGTSSLEENKCRNDQIQTIWTENQHPFLDLCVNKKKLSLSTEEFRICLLEQWVLHRF